MYVTPSGPQSIGGVLDDAIRLYRHSFSRCWILVFLPAVAFAVWQIGAAHYVPGYGLPRSPAAAMAIGRQHPLPGVMLFWMFVLFIVSLSFQGAVAALQAAFARRDESFTLGRAFATAFARLPPLIVSAILLYLALVGVVLVVVIPLALLSGILHLAVKQPAVTAAFAVILVIVMLAVTGRLQLFMAAIYIDREGPLASIRTSWRLTKGHWWRATAILTTAMIMLLVLYLAVSVLSFLGAYLTHNGPANRFVIAPVILIVTYVVIYPLMTAVWVAMYNDFKLRREGGDLAARVGALNSA